MKTLSFFRRAAWALVLAPLTLPALSQVVPLADQPVFTIVPVPGNMALAMSVEFPTVLSTAHPTIGLTGTDPNYSSSTEYLGYFDPNKCYAYNYSAVESNRHFYPTGLATNRTCSNAWSGNLLNWITTSTIDAFRWALTGGYRKVDTAQSGGTPGVTWLEKSWSSSSTTEANTTRHPMRRLTTNTAVTASTPLGTSSARFRVNALGNKMWISVNNTLTGTPTLTDYTGTAITNANAVYEISVRVKVCDAAIGSLGLAGLEANCVRYGSASPYTYKPEGLMQKYAEKIRYSVFGYLNDSSVTRDGGVLRARQAFIGLNQPVPLSTSVPNPVKEWDPNTGVIYPNPRFADADQTVIDFTDTTAPSPIVNSGALNYVNKFGQINPSLTYDYKGYDPVGELYYAATRYLKGLPNVPSWTNMTSDTSAKKNQFLDGFPVIRDWTWPATTPQPPTAASPTPSDVRDPILYSCQKNFILGIGDVNTHADKNVPGKTAASGTGNEPSYPSQLSLDPVPSATRTNQIGTLEGLGNIGNLTCLPWCNSNNSYLMTGIAYDSNTSDIRPDNANQQTVGKQTIQTYWVDVLEYSKYQRNNQFYLAAKYGGFKVPPGYVIPTALVQDSWYTSTRMSPIPEGGGATQQMPDNYFVSSRADELVAGLSAAFAKIDAEINASTTASATAQPQVSTAGDVSYSATYESKTWSSEVNAELFNLTNNTITPLWSFSSKLASQLAGTGWNLNRRMATWNGSQGVPFRHGNLTTTQQTALDTTWITGDDSANFLNYLRGDRTNELTSPGYRKRPTISPTDLNPNFVGSIINSKLRVVGPPSALLEDEEGYAEFKTLWGPQNASNLGRPTIVYVGSNAGVVHAIVGAPYSSAPPTPPAGTPIPEVNPKAGQELFAYVPSALFQGTSSPSTAATRSENALASLGKTFLSHHYMVNANPMKFDVDITKTVAGLGGNVSCLRPKAGGGYEAQNWRTLLIGGLGKGGRSYYALDVTDPASITDEAALASKVMWEFPRSNDPKDTSLADKVGFTFGEPVVVRTKRYGWVVVLTSGYNSVDGQSYFFMVDPCTGYLVQAPIRTKSGITSVGMAHASSYMPYGSALADAAYGVDLSGNVWRLAMTSISTDFPEAELIATLTDSDVGSPVANNSTARQPITTRLWIEEDPKTGARFVMVGTGRLLDTTDSDSTQKQTYYAFRDGKQKFDTTLVTATALVRNDFIDISNSLTAGGVFTSSQKGWRIDMGAKGDGSGASWSGVGWRMVDNAQGLPGQGLVMFVAILPSKDPCSAGANSVLYVVNFGKGESNLAGTGSVFVDDRVIDAKFFTDGTGKTRIKYGKEKTGVVEYLDQKQLPLPTWRQLNWREIPLSQ